MSLLTKAALAFLLTTFTAVGLISKNIDYPTIQKEEQQQEQSTLQNALKSVFLIKLEDYGSAGTAIAVGRKNTEDSNYLYRAITAQHVIRKMQKALTKNKDSSKSLKILFQRGLHSPVNRIGVELITIDWSIPANDWSSFTFKCEEYFPCLEIATKEEFESIKPFENIYAIGCDGGYSIQLKKGIIGSSRNEHLDVVGQQSKSTYPWNKNTDRFFRPYISIWYGSSGGAVLNKDGKVIGVITGVAIGGFQAVAHSAIALKSYIILEDTQYKENLFKIEK